MVTVIGRDVLLKGTLGHEMTRLLAEMAHSGFLRAGGRGSNDAMMREEAEAALDDRRVDFVG